MLAKKSSNNQLVKKSKKITSTKVAKEKKAVKTLVKSPKTIEKKKVDEDIKQPLVESKIKTKSRKSLEKPSIKVETKTKKTKDAKVLKEGKKSTELKPKTATTTTTASPKNKGKKAAKKDDKFKEIRDEFSEQIEKFRIQLKTIKTAIVGAMKTRENNPKLKNELFNEQYGLFLQINSFHISNRFKRILHIPLRNSLLTSDSEICLIVPDVKGIPNKEHEKHLEHYEELFNKHGINNMFKKIMTFHEFRTEYETFEMKNRLSNMYDVFLVDSRISGKVVHKCGKIFYKSRKVPTCTRLYVSKLKNHLNKVLCKTQMHLHNKGNSFMVQFGHNEMSIENLIENVYYILTKLGQDFPGGFDNIQNIIVYTEGGLKIPIYNSLKKRNEVVLPKQLIKKPKWAKTVRGELSTTLDKEVIVTPTGTVKVVQLKPNQSEEVTEEMVLDEEEEEEKVQPVVEKKIKRKSAEKSDDNQIKIKKKKKVVKKTKNTVEKRKLKK